MKLKKLIMPLLQVAVTVLLLLWIFHDPQKRHQMASALQYANSWWLLLGFIFFGFTQIILGARWYLLLKVQKIEMGKMRTFQLVMIGMFFNLFLLGSTGGDLLKTFYAMKEAPQQKTGVFLSIVIDRLVGLFSAMMISLFICFFSFSELWKTPVTRGLLTTMLAVFGGFTVALIMSLIINSLHLWKRLPHWIPGHRFLVDIATAFSLYASSTYVLFKTVLLSLFSNVFLFASAICAAYSFASLPGAPGAGPMIVVLPIVNTITAIPVSLSGIGLREGLFETLLNTLYGTPQSLAVLISLTSFFLWVLWSFVGGVIYLFYKPSRGGSLSFHEMAGQVESIEEVIEEKADYGNH
ncbi:MAG: flippase-like domain-containing protein [Chthoniobacterales bacterium]|nr:flippase-like domain-containing protein [Chthoniobacterales bacterium]